MERNGAGSCTCISGYHGDPYIGCRPECVQNNDCPHDKACLGMKCRNPCPGSCGVNAECNVINHIPQCFCIPGFTGNADTFCKKIEPSMNIINSNGPLNSWLRFFLIALIDLKENLHLCLFSNII